MKTTIEFLNEVYKNTKRDYQESDQKEDALVLIDELILTLTNLK
tara:strand:- start:1441 stop:1572 length:132 start_codon:yes stop_codon:yes gene_type:complete